MTDDRSPRLIWTDSGAPRSGRFDDVYFSRDDGLAESRAVFLDGCGLPGAWAGRSRFTVAELGFGTGLNIAALLALWRRHRPPGGRLHIFTIEAFPLSREEAARALSAWPELVEEAAALTAAWPAPTPGFHRLDLPDEWHVTLDLAVAPVEAALAQWQGRADAWFLDGFAPAANPDMWTGAVLDAVAGRSIPGTRLATFTVAGEVRRGLQAAGFEVHKRPGHGRKRERLEALIPGRHDPAAAPRVAVIGGGIAGQATVRALRALGAHPLLIEAEAPGAGASGFPAALVTPRLDVGDLRLAALFAQALTRAGALYDRIPGAVIARGVVQLEQAARDGGRFDVVAAQDLWPVGALRRLDPDAAASALGETTGVGGLDMAGALAVDPAAIRRVWLEDVESITAGVAGVAPDADGVRLSDAGGELILRAESVVIASGWGTDALLPGLGLKPVRGQADWVAGPATRAVAWGGYAVPTAEGLLFGATHDRDRTDVDTDDADTARNLATLATRLPALAARVRTAEASGRRAAIRATTRDRLPAAGPLGPGVFVLGGLGSRGFAMAPLLAEHVAALAVGAPSPLPRDMALRVDPARLAERAGLSDR
ncbi:tRNA (5-methylaminomethyl-2-thiouridine)(34)-methyltransferase MnmD [Brevundimonas sp.]|uniref:tRNA (5-methylaminomethyl-2-thiouridine)(34)-methyltransferase MnmD n=1 Tax=Brevundimonas sp. TaxID=1871086 RepID=UPI0026186B51|nr:tRNA (5-methylaminomethyl-2-thiouridine)(34)-methyltransferase MnmD [Brevundimonas sp.]